MRILSIETSCDETAISIIEAHGTYPDTAIIVEADILVSQASLHAAYGGVFPNLARREHAKNLPVLLRQALEKAGYATTRNPHVIPPTLRAQISTILHREPELFDPLVHLVEAFDVPPIDAIAVTFGPGLEPALWVGINVARALACAWGDIDAPLPLVPIDHMEGHLLIALLKKDGASSQHHLATTSFPILSLLVSGGHTEFVLSDTLLSHTLLGETRDDAAGEAFDKVARMMELPYPGGPEIARRALQGKPNATFVLPRPMVDSKDLDVSFSGLKTAVLYKLRDLPPLSEENKNDLCYEFQEAVVDVLVKKTLRAVKQHGAKTVTLGGGVSANTRLREALARALDEETPGVALVVPDPSYSTDNALMIALAAYLRLEAHLVPTHEPLVAAGNVRIGPKVRQ